MNRKKIVSIEDHIPKFKESRKKKQNRKLIIYLSIFFLVISLVIYIQSPLSRVNTVQVDGNALLSDQEVRKLSGISKDTNIWSVQKEQLSEKLENTPLIKSAVVSRNLPGTISIKIEEYERIGYVAEDKGFEPLFSSGKTIKKSMKKSMPGDAPILYGFKKSSKLKEMATELEKMNPSIRKLISEIHLTLKADNKKEEIELFMNDGLLVNADIDDFAKKMEIYPSIASQINPKTKGIVHIGVGAYFEKQEEPKEKKKEVESESAN